MTTQKKKKEQLPKPIIISSFPLGRLVATPGALAKLDEYERHELVQRHVACDWGDCCEDDIRASNEALLSGSRLVRLPDLYRPARRNQ